MICNLGTYFVGSFPTYNVIAHQLMGLALGLLLVFRTNSAYDRFWEGRRMYGSPVYFARRVSWSSPEPCYISRLFRVYFFLADKKKTGGCKHCSTRAI